MPIALPLAQLALFAHRVPGVLKGDSVGHEDDVHSLLADVQADIFSIFGSQERDLHHSPH